MAGGRTAAAARAFAAWRAIARRAVCAASGGPSSFPVPHDGSTLDSFSPNAKALSFCGRAWRKAWLWRVVLLY